MTKQIIEVMVMAEIDCDKWLFDQRDKEQQLKNYLQMAVQDQIDRIQGGEPTSCEYDTYVELEYGGQT